MLTVAVSEGIVTLVGGVVGLQALDDSCLLSLIQFLGSPEHTGGGLLDEDSGDLTLCGGDLEGGLVADIDLLQEFHLTGSLVKQHEADVGSVAGLEGDGDVLIGSFHFVLNLGDGEVLGIATLGIQRCGVVGVDDVFTVSSLLLSQLQLVGQGDGLIAGDLLTEGPDELLGGLAVTGVVIQPEGGLGCLRIGEGEGSGSAFLGIDLSGVVLDTVIDQRQVLSLGHELEVAILVCTDEVLNIGAGSDGCDAACSFDSGEEVLSYLVFTVVVDQIEQQRSGVILFIACQEVHEAVTQLDVGGAGVLLNLDVGRTVLIAGSFAAQCIAGVAGGLHFLIGLVCFVLSALIVQSVLGVSAGADSVSGGAGQVVDNPAESAGGETQSLGILAVFSHVVVEPLRIFVIFNGEGVGVLVTVSSDPLFNIGPESVEVVVVTVGDHVQRGVLTTLGLPQIVTPVIVVLILQIHSVDDGGGQAVLIVEVVGTAGSDDIEVLVGSFYGAISIQHSLGGFDVAVEVGGTCGHSLDGCQTAVDDALIVFSGQFGKAHSYIGVVLNSDEAQLDGNTVFHQRLHQIDHGLTGVVFLGNTGAQCDDDIHGSVFGLTANGQSDIGLVVFIQAVCFLVNGRLGLYRGNIGSCGRLGFYSVDIGTIDGLFLLYTVLIFVVQVGVAVCGKISIVYEALFCGVHSDFVLQRVSVGAEHCTVLHVPGQLVDVAALIAFDISAAVYILISGNQLHNNGRILSGQRSDTICPTAVNSPDDIAGGVVNDLQSRCIQVNPLGHVVGDIDIIEGGLGQVGQSALQSLAQTSDAVGLDKGGLFVLDAGIHPGGVAVIVHNIHCGDLLHSSQLISSLGSTLPAVAIGDIAALIGAVVEQILNVGAIFLVILDEGALRIGYGVLDAGNQAGVSIDIRPQLICKGDEFFVSNFAAESTVQQSSSGNTVKAVTEDLGESCRQLGAVKNSLFESNLSDSQCAKGGPGLPVVIEVSGSLVGIQVAVGDEDHIDFVQSFVVICDVLSNAGKACLTVGGGTAVQQSAGQFTQSGCQFTGILNMDQDFVIAHTEGHQGQLSIAAAVQDSLTDGGDGFLHGGPLVIHGVRAVNHQDDFVVTLVTVHTGNSDLNLKTVGITVNQLVGLVRGGFGSDGVILGRSSGNQGVDYIEGGFDVLGNIHIDVTFCHADHGLRTVGALLGGEDVCVLGQILLTGDIQGELEGLCLAQLQTFNGVEALIVSLGCVFTGQLKGAGLLNTVSIQVGQDYIQVVLFAESCGQGELQACFVSVSGQLLAYGQGDVLRKGLVVDDNGNIGVGISLLLHQPGVQSAGSGCAFGVVLAVQAVAHLGACCGQVANDHTVNAVQGSLRAVCPGPDSGLHSIQSFAFGHLIDDLSGQLDIHRSQIPIDIAAVVVFAFGKLIAGGELLSVHHLDVVFVLNFAVGNSCLQSFLQACQAAGTGLGAPVTVEHDTADMILSFFGSIVIIIFQVCQCVPAGALSAGCQVNAVTVVGVALFVHQQELLGTGTGSEVVRTVNIGGQLGAVVQGGAAGGMFQMVDDVVTSGILHGMAVSVFLIDNADMADIVAAVVAVADILEGIAFGCVGDGEGGRIVEVTVVGIQFTGHLLCLLICSTVAVKLQCGLDRIQFADSLLGGDFHLTGGCGNLTLDAICGSIVGGFINTGGQINGDHRCCFCFFRAYAHKHSACQHDRNKKQGQCFGEYFLHF